MNKFHTVVTISKTTVRYGKLRPLIAEKKIIEILISVQPFFSIQFI